MSMTRRQRIRKAERYLAIADDYVETGFFKEAIDYYRESIKCFPTPEAYTALGWAYAHTGDFQQAIEFCKVAISLDPNYGNPYGEIGACLLEMGEMEEAAQYLRRAILARNADETHLAYYNLGRVWEARKNFSRAILEYRRALEIEPDFEPARQAFFRLVRMFN
jgi:tetratricopeptide (TPR) repeat protein